MLSKPVFFIQCYYLFYLSLGLFRSVPLLFFNESNSKAVTVSANTISMGDWVEVNLSIICLYNLFCFAVHYSFYNWCYSITKIIRKYNWSLQTVGTKLIIFYQKLNFLVDCISSFQKVIAQDISYSSIILYLILIYMYRNRIRLYICRLFKLG